MKIRKYTNKTFFYSLTLLCSFVVTNCLATSNDTNTAKESANKIILPYPFAPYTPPQETDTMQLPTANDYAPPKEEDFSKLSWAEAFTNMNKKMSQEFAYTEHKKISWDYLFNKYLPSITNAEKNKDMIQYYAALRGYIAEINDNHTHVLFSTEAAAGAAINNIFTNTGGGYGFAITHINDGSAIVSYLDTNGPAAKAGIQPKAKILQWNGKQINEAIAEQAITWADDGSPGQLRFTNFASETKDGRDYEQSRLITRAAIGNQATITFQNPGNNSPQTVTLSAINDNFQSYLATTFHNINDDDSGTPAQMVWHKTLPSGYGYIRVANESNCTPTYCPSYDNFYRAMTELHSAPGIILDIRDNSGGNDGFSADIVGFFSNRRVPMVDIWPYNDLTKKYDIVSHLYSFPHQPTYEGQVVVLTDIGTFCAGEGIAQGMKQLPQAHLMSYYANTGGSYSFTNKITLPGGYYIQYAVRRITAPDGKIFEGNDKLEGGVKTDDDAKIPLNAETAYDIVTHQMDPAVDYAVSWLQKHGTSPIINGGSSDNSNNHSSNNLGLGIGVAATAAAAAIIGTEEFASGASAGK